MMRNIELGKSMMEDNQSVKSRSNVINNPVEDGPGDSYLCSFCPNFKLLNCFNGARCYSIFIFGENLSECLGKVCCIFLPLIKQCMESANASTSAGFDAGVG